MSQADPFEMQRASLAEQHETIDAVTIPVVFLTTGRTYAIDTPAFVSDITAISVPNVRTRIDTITGKEAHQFPLAWDGDRLKVHMTNKRAQDLLGAASVRLGNVQLQMEDLKHFVEEQLLIDGMAQLASSIRHQFIANLPRQLGRQATQ